MTENEITLFNKNIDLCIKKLKETRIFIQNLDTIYMNNHNFKSKKDIPENCDYYEQRKTLNITMLCYAINLDITIIQKHMLLSIQEKDSIYFSKLLCMTIYEGINSIHKNIHYIKEHTKNEDFKLFKLKLSKVDRYRDILASIRNHSSAHIDNDFITYYDSLISVFSLPLDQILCHFIDLLKFTQELCDIINKEQLIEQKEKLIQITITIIENLKNNGTSANNELLQYQEGLLNFLTSNNEI